MIDTVYVNYHSYKDVTNSIKSLYEVFKNSGIKNNIYIVDNSYNEVSKKIIKKIKSFCNNYKKNNFQATYLPSKKNIGFGAAVNLALLKSKSPLILLINCDTDLSSLSLEELIKLIKKFSDEIVIAGPRIIDEYGFDQESVFSFDPISILLKPVRHIKKIGKISKILTKNPFINKYLEKINYQNQKINKPCYVDWISGCFMLIDRNFLDNCGGFDNRYFLYFEDVDICRTARKFGKSVLYDPNLKIMHRGNYESAKKKGVLNSIFFNKVSRYHISSWLKYLWKWKSDFLFKLVYLLKINPKVFKNSVQFSLIREYKK